MLRYKDVRNQIKDGDAFLFEGCGKFYQTAIKVRTLSKFVHVGSALWIDDRLFILEAHWPRGVDINPLTNYLRDGKIVHWYSFAKSGFQPDRKKMRKFGLNQIRKEYPTLWQLFRNFSPIIQPKVPEVPRDSWFCSKLYAGQAVAGGYPLESNHRKRLSDISPGDIPGFTFLRPRGILHLEGVECYA